MKIALTTLLVTLVLVVSACSGSDTSTSTPTTPTQTITTDVVTGTVQVPANGVLQSSFATFNVGQGGGTVSITLTSAVETLPGGTLLTSVTMGLGIGSVNGPACTLLTNAFTTAQAASAPQLSGTLSAGAYCVQVSDVTNQLGPVSYAVAIAHP